MRYFIFPSKDASVYQSEPTKNTGFDEILEVGKTDEGRYAARSLLQFDIPDSIPENATFDLVLHVANASRVNRNQVIEIYPLDEDWIEGTGYFYQTVIGNNDGVTWQDGVAVINTPVTHSLVYPIKDLNINISSLVQSWISASNFGLVIQFPNVDEANTSNFGNLKFFSGQTHTIYRPTLVAKWNDQIYESGSSPAPTSSLKVQALPKSVYYQSEIAVVDVLAGELYPQKTFATQFTRNNGEHYLPQDSFFSIIDEQSGTTIIPFSDESRISVSGNRNYFSFRLNCLYPRRFYRILIKVGNQIFDNNTIFTVK
jgi:hypothetical protein